MKKSDLYSELARVIDMCEGTGVDPKFCWKYEGVNINGMPYFDSELEQYEFALGIVEGKPVFEGDRIWSKRAKMFVLAHKELIINDDCFSWQEQNRTFNLNGVELPCPENQNAEEGYMLGIFHDGSLSWYLFKSYTNRYKVAQQLIKILNEAAGK
jgi:hypothetical protein